MTFRVQQIILQSCWWLSVLRFVGRGKRCIKHCWFIYAFPREQEKYLLRIQELETAVARLGEESIDKATLLESVQSDKETISRSENFIFLFPLSLPRFPFCLPYNSHDVSSENLASDQLIIPQLIFLCILSTCLLEIHFVSFSARE